MKKFYLFLLLAFLSSNAVLAIEENYGSENDYAPIYLEPDTPTFFSKLKKNEIYTLDNYRENGMTSSANIDSISREDIKRQNSTFISDILNQLGSVTTQNSNGSEGSVTTLRIRGTDRVRTTLDGIRIDRPSMTSPGIETQFLLSDDIELVEVIKGPQGNVSGTNASGGVISMQTRRGEGPFSAEASSSMGDYGMFKERFAVMGGNEKADYYLSTSWYKTDGGMRTKNMGRIYNDGYKNLSAVSNLGYRVLDNRAEIRNVFKFSNATKGTGIGYNSLNWQNYNDPNDYLRNVDIFDSLSFKHSVNDFITYSARFGIYHNDSNSHHHPDEILPIEYGESKISSTRLNFMNQHDIKFKDWNTLSIGYNLENEYIDGSSDYLSYGSWTPFPMEHYVSNYSGSTLQNDVYVNDVINIKDTLILRGGARLTHNSDFGTYVSPNGSAALVLPTFKLDGAKTKFRSSWGKSINTPTLYQRFGVLDMGFTKWVGNPDLKAEKFSSWDVGVEQYFMDEKLKFELGYFDSDYKDYIGDFYTPDWSMGYYYNVNSAKIHGYEGKVSFEPNDKLKFVFNYTYTDSKDGKTGFDLPAVPRNRFNGTVYFTPFERWNLYAGIENASSRNTSFTRNDRVSGYTDARIGTSVRLFKIKNLNVYLRGNIYNLFNQNICMSKYNNDYYYGPKIRFNAGLFFEYNSPKKNKEKERV